jgi:hypothetical protein
MPIPKYMDKIIGDVTGKVEELSEGQRKLLGILEVTVLHDDWCKLLKGKGECNCSPEYKYSPPNSTEH